MDNTPTPVNPQLNNNPIQQMPTSNKKSLVNKILSNKKNYFFIILLLIVIVAGIMAIKLFFTPRQVPPLTPIHPIQKSLQKITETPVPTYNPDLKTTQFPMVPTSTK